MMKLDLMKHGDIAVLHIDGYSLAFVAGELFAVKNGNGVLYVSDKLGKLEFSEWHEFAIGEAFPNQPVTDIESIKHDELDQILHVKSMRTLRFNGT